MSKFSSKFVEVLKTFNENELKLFEKWLHTPWCNSNKNLIRIFEKLKKYHPSFDDLKLTKERLFRKALPGRKFSEYSMNNLLSAGYLTAEKFLIVQNLLNDENLQKDLLTKEFQKRHLIDYFFKNAEKEISRLESKKVKVWEDHLDLFRMHRRIYHHPNQSQRWQPGGRTIVRMGEELDLVYLLEKATIINEKIFRNQILKNENHEIEHELKIWRLASEGIEHLSLELYKMRFNYSNEGRLERYFELRNTFMKRYKELNQREQKIHFTSLLNDSTLLVRTNKMELTETLPLYKLGLKTGLLIHGDILNHKLYSIIVSASNWKRDFKFTQFFIENYTDKLELTLQSDAQNWAEAHTFFIQKNQEECLEVLQTHHFKNLYFVLISKVLSLQSYFELYLKDDSYESFLFDYLNSFEKWVLREKFRSQFTKKSYLRLIQVSRKLAYFYTDVNFKSEKMKDILSNESNIQAPKWLEEKAVEIEELKQSHR